jgi:hypothetical protein
MRRDFEKEIAGMLEAAGAHNEAAVLEAEEALALKVGATMSQQLSTAPAGGLVAHGACMHAALQALHEGVSLRRPACMQPCDHHASMDLRDRALSGRPGL